MFSVSEYNIDAVVVLANRLKFNTVFDSCERYIAEQVCHGHSDLLGIFELLCKLTL